MFKRILFPTDGSEQANRALETVTEIARKFNSEVIILHTIDTKEINEELLKECNQITISTISKLEESGIKYQSFIKEGLAGPLIISTAESEDCDSIIMGIRGAGLIKRLLVGSVSNYVVHHSKCQLSLVY